MQKAGLLFDDGVVAVGEEALAHGVCVLFLMEGAYLDMDEIVGSGGSGADRVAAGAKGPDEEICVLLVRHSGDLDHEGATGCGGRGV